MIYDNVDIDKEEYVIGTIAGICGALFGSILTVSVKFLHQTPHNILIFYAGLGGLFDALVISNFDEQSQFFHDLQAISLPKVFFVALVGITANLMAIKCYQLISPTIASIFRSQEIVFAFILQAAVMGQNPNTCSISGAFLVVMSAILVPMEEKVIANIRNPTIKNWI